VAAIEVNGAYYSSQKPATFAKWAASTPDDFVFMIAGDKLNNPAAAKTFLAWF
jgi:uncharacterized protein YecE (DUF72 family)